MNIDITSLHGDDRNPSLFLSNQLDAWTKFWAPQPFSHEHHEVAACMTHIREYAVDMPKRHIEPGRLKHEIKSYPKQTKGCDAWTQAELDGMPDVCISGITDSFNHMLDKVAQPHQNMLSLSPCLGKPGRVFDQFPKPRKYTECFVDAMILFQNGTIQYSSI